MFIVALTGGIATGKSTVLSIFREHGVPVIDADEVAIQVLEIGTKPWKELRLCFGDEVFDPDGSVNRLRLEDIILNDIKKRHKLNAITHPHIQLIIIKRVLLHFFSGHKYVVLEAPLLFEVEKMSNFIDKIITVFCEDYQQLERLMRRNELPPLDATRWIITQMSLDYKVANSHFVIDNSGDIEYTRRQTSNLIRVLNRSNIIGYCRAVILIAVFSILYDIVLRARYAFINK